MSNHKRKRPANRRAGCKMCKPWKINGHATERPDGEKYSDHKRRMVAIGEIKEQDRQAGDPDEKQTR